jgi:hypothetical protein
VLASTDSAKKGVVVGEEGRGYVLAVRLRTLDTQVSLFVRWNDAPALDLIGSTVTAISMDSTKRYCVLGAPAGEPPFGFISAGDRLKIVKVMRWQNAWYAAASERRAAGTADRFVKLLKPRWFPLSSTDWRDGELEESGWLSPGDIVFDEDSNKNPPLTVGEECFAQFPHTINGKLEYFKVYYIFRPANYLNCVEKADDGKLHFYKVYIVPHIQNILSHTEYLNYVEEADDGEVHYYHNFSKVFRIFLCFSGPV